MGRRGKRTNDCSIEQMWLAVMTGQVQRGMHIPIADAVKAMLAAPEEERAEIMLDQIAEDGHLANEIAVMFVGAFYQLRELAKDAKREN